MDFFAMHTVPNIVSIPSIFAHRGVPPHFGIHHLYHILKHSNFSVLQNSTSEVIICMFPDFKHRKTDRMFPVGFSFLILQRVCSSHHCQISFRHHRVTDSGTGFGIHLPACREHILWSRKTFFLPVVQTGSLLHMESLVLAPAHVQ